MLSIQPLDASVVAPTRACTWGPLMRLLVATGYRTIDD
jgi:hypothetical protein